MRVDTIITDPKRAARAHARVLTNGLTAEDNLAPSGVPEGWVLTSTGPNTPPEWRPLP